MSNKKLDEVGKHRRHVDSTKSESGIKMSTIIRKLSLHRQKKMIEIHKILKGIKD